jgi:peptidoglycan hydrolase-like protein with peptidoglycan-binding domain
VLLVLLLAAGAAAVFASARASLTADQQGLAQIGLPLGGGRIESVIAVTGPTSRRVGVTLRGDRIWPTGTIRAGERITLDVVVRRPGWIAWLAGRTQRLELTVTAPASAPIQDYVTIRAGAPLTIHFTRPVSAVVYGPNPGQLSRHALAAPTTRLTLTPSAAAGSVWVAGLARAWETAPARPVTWFPAGASTSAVARPAPGTSIRPATPITFTFSQPVSQVLRGSLPTVSPATSGSWHEIDAHTITFRPAGFGYGLGARVAVALPAGVSLVGGHPSGASEVGGWTVPPGSTLRLQQLLATLGYLPFRFTGHAVPLTPADQENAAIHPPTGSLLWRYANIPDALRSMWAPGSSGVITRGAVMAFENDHGLTPDGDPGPQVWRALIAATLSGHGTSFGYTFVMVSEASPESLTLWHSGHDLFTVPVNTGIPSAPTATGTYPVFEHIPSGTMSGTNPDGTHYNDKGIPWISYFNGGDALHGFYRAQYGFPQSLGCVEMSATDAGRVWPYTPIGTLVHIA